MYETFFGFKDTPFRLSADEKFRYAHKNYLRASAYLAYALQQGEGLVMITGKPGSGKTTLIRDVISELDSTKYHTLNLVTSQLHAEELLRKMALEYGLPAETYNKATLLTNIHKHLNMLHTQGKHSILFLDEAQNLSTTGLEELRLLSNLQEGKHSLLQIVLAGHEELRRLLLSPGMEHIQQRLVATCRIEPMSLAQTQGYITHRLEQVGWRQDPMIQDEVFHLIHEAAQGVPRNINHLMSHLLLFASIEEKHDLTDEDALTVIEELVDQQRITLPGECDFEGFVSRYRAQSEHRLIRLAVGGQSVAAPLPDATHPPSREQALTKPADTESQDDHNHPVNEHADEENSLELEEPDSGWFLWRNETAIDSSTEPAFDSGKDQAINEEPLPLDQETDQPAEVNRRSGTLLPNADDIWHGTMSSMDMAGLFEAPKAPKHSDSPKIRTESKPVVKPVVMDREHSWGGVWFMSSENSSSQSGLTPHGTDTREMDNKPAPASTLKLTPNNNIAVDENLAMPSLWIDGRSEVNPSTPEHSPTFHRRHTKKKSLLRSLGHVFTFVAIGVTAMLAIRYLLDNYDQVQRIIEPHLLNKDNIAREIAPPPHSESDHDTHIPEDPVKNPATVTSDIKEPLSTPPVSQGVATDRQEVASEKESESTVSNIPPVIDDPEIDSFENIELATRYVVHFDFNKSSIPRQSKSLLKSIRDKMLLEEESYLQITGYADSQGNSTYNYRLSLKRAKEVKDFFVFRGIAEDRLQMAALGSVGSSEPWLESIDAKQEVRRVEVILFPK
ncbi:MAG: AAA family ATPase [Candidatus Thiodiazotropha sp.]